MIDAADARGLTVARKNQVPTALKFMASQFRTWPRLDIGLSAPQVRVVIVSSPEASAWSSVLLPLGGNDTVHSLSAPQPTLSKAHQIKYHTTDLWQ